MSKWSMKTPDRPNRIDVFRSDVIKALGLSRITYGDNLAMNEVINDMIGGHGPIRHLPHRALQREAWNDAVELVANEIKNKLGIGIDILPEADDSVVQDMWPDTLPWDEDEQGYYRDAKKAGIGGIEWPPCSACGKLEGFRPYPFANGMLECKHCHSVQRADVVAEQFNNMIKQHTDQLDEYGYPDEPGELTLPESWGKKSGWFRKKKEIPGSEPVVREPDPSIRPTTEPYDFPDSKPVIYPQIPSEGLPFFIAPDGEIFTGEPGSSHVTLRNDLLLPRGLHKSLQTEYDKWSHGRLFPEGLEDYNRPLTPEQHERLLKEFEPYLRTAGWTDRLNDWSDRTRKQLDEGSHPWKWVRNLDEFNQNQPSIKEDLSYAVDRLKGGPYRPDDPKYVEGQGFFCNTCGNGPWPMIEQYYAHMENEHGWTTRRQATSYPAHYTDDDPLDLKGKQPLFESMSSNWSSLPPEDGKRAVVNAFRATMLSPQMNLQGNAILYQLLMNIDPNETNPDVFENTIRNMKQQWDLHGQTDLFSDPEQQEDPNQFMPGKLNNGIWANIRRLAGLGLYADQLYQAAMDDYEAGGTGETFRDRVLKMGIPGVGTKVSSFAWLALAPTTSELGTIDRHMMHHLNQEAESPKNQKEYFELEKRLRDERDDIYPGVPLTQYQWGVWDKRRTPGFHQDHTPLRPIDPTPYTDVKWETPPKPKHPQPFNPDPDQLGFQFDTKAGGWRIDKNPFKNSPIRWQPAKLKYKFEEFVISVANAMNAEYPLDETGRSYIPTDIWNQIHDLTLELTKGMIPVSEGVHRRGQDWYAAVKQVADSIHDQIPALQLLKIPTKDLRPQTDQEYVDENYNGIAPKNKPPSVWSRVSYPLWTMYRLGGFSLQGEFVGIGSKNPATGIAVMPERQSKEEILKILDQLPTHRDDYLKQRQQVPEWSINRGGKVAGFRLSPDATGYTYAPGAIIVSEHVDVNDNWLLFHDSCVGIVAGIGGSASHGVQIARERNLPIIVNLEGWNQIKPGDTITINPITARVDINGGDTRDLGTPQQAMEPTIAFVWSQGHGLYEPIPLGSGGASVLHRPMIRQLKQQGTFNKLDYALGVIYNNGRIQTQGDPSDKEQMQQWLNSIQQPTTSA